MSSAGARVRPYVPKPSPPPPRSIGGDSRSRPPVKPAVRAAPSVAGHLGVGHAGRAERESYTVSISIQKGLPLCSSMTPLRAPCRFRCCLGVDGLTDTPPEPLWGLLRGG